MSQSDVSEAELIKEATNIAIENYVAVVVTILLPIYDFAITFDREVEIVWLKNRKLSLASILLMSTRWCMFIGAISLLVPTPTLESCKPVVIVNETMEFAGFVNVAVFSALRASALWERNYAIFCVVLILCLAPIITNTYIALHFVYSFQDGGCYDIPEGLSDEVIRTLSLATRLSMIVADALVLVLTSLKTYRQVIDSKRLGIKLSLSTCLLRDGTVYFVILFIINMLEILTNRTTADSIIGFFAGSFPPVLINRFMLNLRQIGSGDDMKMTSRGDFSQVSMPRFHLEDSIFANFAEPLEHGASCHEDDAPENSTDTFGVAQNTCESTSDSKSTNIARGVIRTDQEIPCRARKPAYETFLAATSTVME